MSSIVFDATALIHFSRAGRLRELQVSSTEDEAILLANVSKELERGGPLRPTLDPATAAWLNRAALEEWTGHLDALGTRHSPPIVALAGWLLIVPDPDGLRLRFYTTQPHGLSTSRVEHDSPWLSAGPAAAPGEQPARHPSRSAAPSEDSPPISSSADTPATR